MDLTNFPTSGATPAGTGGELQYNNAGALGAAAGSSVDAAGNVKIGGVLHAPTIAINPGSQIHFQWDTGEVFFVMQYDGLYLPHAALHVNRGGDDGSGAMLQVAGGASVTGGATFGGPLTVNLPVSAPTVANSQCQIWIDETTGNLKVTAKQSDGTARTYTLTHD